MLQFRALFISIAHRAAIPCGNPGNYFTDRTSGDSNMYRNAVAAAFLIFFSSAVNAQAAGAEAEEEGPWSGTASLGYLSTSGNTDTTSYNTAFKISYAQNLWTHTFDAAANGASESDMTTAESYQAGWKSSYDFSEHSYMFGTVNWRKDRFSGVDQQLSEAVGYGRRIIETPVHLLSAEIGAGHRNIDFRDNTSDSGAILTLGADYIWTFSETSNFEQNIAVESGSENTFIESISAVRARLLGDLAIVLSYTVRHNTDVPLGSTKTDKLTAISLELAF
jgi:putative salt-induced outer membrane protein